MHGVHTCSWRCPIGLHLVTADPETIAARRWIHRRLAWENRLAALHARGGTGRADSSKQEAAQSRIARGHES